MDKKWLSTLHNIRRNGTTQDYDVAPLLEIIKYFEGVPDQHVTHAVYRAAKDELRYWKQKAIDAGICTTPTDSTMPDLKEVLRGIKVALEIGVPEYDASDILDMVEDALADRTRPETPRSTETDSEVYMRVVLGNIYENLQRPTDERVAQCVQMTAAALRAHAEDTKHIVHNDFTDMDALSPHEGDMRDEAGIVRAEWAGTDPKRGNRLFGAAFVEGYVECFKKHRRAIKAGAVTYEPQEYLVGNYYYTKSGKLIKMVAREDDDEAPSCIQSKEGIWRYNCASHGFGRITGSRGHPDDLVPLFKQVCN